MINLTSAVGKGIRPFKAAKNIHLLMVGNYSGTNFMIAYVCIDYDFFLDNNSSNNVTVWSIWMPWNWSSWFKRKKQWPQFSKEVVKTWRLLAIRQMLSKCWRTGDTEIQFKRSNSNALCTPWKSDQLHILLGPSIFLTYYLIQSARFNLMFRFPFYTQKFEQKRKKKGPRHPGRVRVWGATSENSYFILFRIKLETNFRLDPNNYWKKLPTSSRIDSLIPHCHHWQIPGDEAKNFLIKLLERWRRFHEEQSKIHRANRGKIHKLVPWFRRKLRCTSAPHREGAKKRERDKKAKDNEGVRYLFSLRMTALS